MKTASFLYLTAVEAKKVSYRQEKAGAGGREAKIDKILTYRRQRPDFGAQKRRFGNLKRRLKMPKRRFCSGTFESRWKSAHYKTTRKSAKNFDKSPLVIRLGKTCFLDGLFAFSNIF